MGADTPATIRGFLDDVPESSASLVTVNRSHPDSVQNLLEEAFATQSVSLTERSVGLDGDDVVALRKDGEIAAVSSLDDVMQSFLLVNGDRFKTSTHGFGEAIPEVLTGMDGTLFDLRGYPDSNKEKLLLILISRHIERLAYEAGSGTFRSTFQRLSRLEDEFGTRKVYERLAGRTLDVHVYGVPDESPEWLDATVHGGTSDEYRNSWCVVFRSSGEAGREAAMVAHQRRPNRWKGFWTYDAEEVARIDAYLDRSF